MKEPTKVNAKISAGGQPSEEDIAALKASGVRKIINLRRAGEANQPLDPAAEGEVVKQAGLDYVHIPVDFAAPTRAAFDAFARAMDARTDQRIHVHCAANYRVSAFYSLYAVRNGLCSQADADQLVAGLWDPTDHPAWTALIADVRSD